MSKIRYSVIIPVYRSEKTIRRCLDSLVPQIQDDTEIILINDGSPDQSGDICRQYAEAHSFVRYYEKENGGVASARNYGLDLAGGTYFLFVDSDDYVTPDFFRSIRSAQSEYDYDLIQFSNYFSNGTNLTERIRKPFQARSRDQLFSKLIETLCRKKSNAPWAKVYKGQIIREKGIRFPENIEVGEDRAFFIHFSLSMNSYCISDIPIYVVNTENEASLSRRVRDDLDTQTAYMNDYLESVIQVSGISETERMEYQKAMNYDRLRMVYAKAKHLARNHTPFRERIQALQSYCKDLKRLKLRYPHSAYCMITGFPVRWNMALLIDLIAWKLTR